MVQSFDGNRTNVLSRWSFTPTRSFITFSTALQTFWRYQRGTLLCTGKYKTWSIKYLALCGKRKFFSGSGLPASLASGEALEPLSRLLQKYWGDSTLCLGCGISLAVRLWPSPAASSGPESSPWLSSGSWPFLLPPTSASCVVWVLVLVLNTVLSCVAPL